MPPMVAVRVYNAALMLFVCGGLGALFGIQSFVMGAVTVGVVGALAAALPVRWLPEPVVLVSSGRVFVAVMVAIAVVLGVVAVRQALAGELEVWLLLFVTGALLLAATEVARIGDRADA